ncbi:MAG: type II toxin-antitoxin system HicB family antitoxin [Phycisphaerae bacterium]
MLLDYVNAAIRRARFELLDDGTWFGKIPRFRGVWANARTRAACRRELQEVVEDWIVINLRLGHNPPRLPGVRLFPPH